MRDRVQHRRQSGVPALDAEEQMLVLADEEARELVREMLGHRAWRELARPALRRRLQALADRALVDFRLEPKLLEEFRLEYRLLRRLLEDPVSFLLGEDQDESGVP